MPFAAILVPLSATFGSSFGTLNLNWLLVDLESGLPSLLCAEGTHGLWDIGVSLFLEVVVFSFRQFFGLVEGNSFIDIVSSEQRILLVFYRGACVDGRLRLIAILTSRLFDRLNLMVWI